MPFGHLKGKKKILTASKQSTHLFVLWLWETWRKNEKNFTKLGAKKKEMIRTPHGIRNISGEFSDCKVETNDQVGKAFWASLMPKPKRRIPFHENFGCTVSFEFSRPWDGTYMDSLRLTAAWIRRRLQATFKKDERLKRDARDYAKKFWEMHTIAEGTFWKRRTFLWTSVSENDQSCVLFNETFWVIFKHSVLM